MSPLVTTPAPHSSLTPARELLLACLPISPDYQHLAILIEQSPDWEELHRLGVHHDILPLIYQVLKELPDLVVPESVLNHFRNWFAAHALRSMQMQKEMRRLIELLTAEKITVIPIKGPTLAEEAYGDIALRSFNDLDLLVPPEQAWEAVHIIMAQGFHLDFELPQARWGSLQRADNHVYLEHSEKNCAVEVHWELFFPGYALPFDLSAHWAALEAGEEGRLTNEETLVMLCAHGARHLWYQLKWLTDIDRLIRNGPQMHWEKILFVAEKAGSLRALLLGLKLSRVLFDTPLTDEILEKIRGDVVVRSLTENVVANLFPENPERRQLIREYTFFLKSRDNMRDRLRLIFRGLLWPRLDDWKTFPLGDKLPCLYYLLRPLRMVWKWLAGPVIEGMRKT